jgi:hypothetical protein
MLTNKDIDIINICLKTTLAFTKEETEDAEKARNDIGQTILNFNKNIQNNK